LRNKRSFAFLLMGVLSGLGTYFFSPALAKGFFYGYGTIFAVDLFLRLKFSYLREKNPPAFLRQFFRAEMQKMILFILLIAFILRYIRPDFFGLLLGLIFALVISRLLMVI